MSTTLLILVLSTISWIRVPESVNCQLPYGGAGQSHHNQVRWYHNTIRAMEELAMMWLIRTQNVIWSHFKMICILEIQIFWRSNILMNKSCQIHVATSVEIRPECTHQASVPGRKRLFSGEWYCSIFLGAYAVYNLRIFLSQDTVTVCVFGRRIFWGGFHVDQFQLHKLSSPNCTSISIPLCVISFCILHQLFRSLYFVFLCDANSDVARRRGTWTKTNRSTSFRNTEIENTWKLKQM